MTTGKRYQLVCGTAVLALLLPASSGAESLRSSQSRGGASRKASASAFRAARRILRQRAAPTSPTPSPAPSPAPPRATTGAGRGGSSARAAMEQLDAASQDALISTLTHLLEQELRARPLGRRPLTSQVARWTALAQERKRRLIARLHEDPRVLSRHLLPEAVRRDLPTSVQAEVEQAVDRQGPIGLSILDKKHSAEVTHYLEDPKTHQETELVLDAPPQPPLAPGDIAQVSGVQLANVLAAQGSKVVLKSTLPQRKALGGKKVAVILANFTDLTTEPLTPAQVSTLVFDPFTGVSAGYDKASGGQMWLEGTAVGWKRLSMTMNTCSPSFLQQMIQTAITAADPDLNYRDYGYVMVLTPETSACNGVGENLGASGVAFIGERFATAEGDINNVAWVSIGGYRDWNYEGFAHEFGHLLGLGHASTFRCSDKVIPTTVLPKRSNGVQVGEATCKVKEYGDFYSTMGSGVSLFRPSVAFNALEQMELGWLPSDAIQIVDAPPAVSRALVPLNVVSSGLKVLSVLKERLYNSSNTVGEIRYIAEFRPDREGLPGFEGLFLYLADAGVFTSVYGSGTWNNTYLLDMTPTGKLDDTDDDFALKAGRTFTDPSGITISASNDSIGPASVNPPPIQVQNIRLTTVIPADTTPPVVQLVDPSAIAETRTVAIEVADNQGPLRQSRLYVDGQLAATESATPLQLKWNPSGLASHSSHQLDVRVTDANGNEGTTSPVTVTLGDTEAPTVHFVGVPSTIIINRQTPYDQQDSFVLKADASDNVGVTQVEFYRDGTRLTVDAAPPYEAKTYLDNGVHVFRAVAEDAAGNQGVAEATVTVLKDLREPTVTFTSPSLKQNQVAQGTIQVSVDAKDDKDTSVGTAVSGVASVRITRQRERADRSLDPAFFQETVLTAAPYSFSWDTTKEPNGVYVLTAVATDRAGNKSSEFEADSEIWVRVDNPPQPPSPTFLAPVLQNGRLVIAWSGEGTLQEATSVIGPWSDVTPQPASPYRVPLNGPMKFYRLVHPTTLASAPQP